MTDRMYTMGEARRELDRQECLSQGHDYNLIEGGAGTILLRVMCGRCSSSWSVTQTYDGLARNEDQGAPRD